MEHENKGLTSSSSSPSSTSSASSTTSFLLPQAARITIVVFGFVLFGYLVPMLLRYRVRERKGYLHLPETQCELYEQTNEQHEHD